MLFRSLTQSPAGSAAAVVPAALQRPEPPGAPAPAELAPAREETPSQRADRLEEEQSFTASQVATLHQDRVQSGSRYRLRLSGIALVNAFATRGSVENLDVPETAQPREAGAGNSSFGATMRQSVIGLDLTGPTVAGGRTSGDLQFDFAGGFAAIENGVDRKSTRLNSSH